MAYQNGIMILKWYVILFHLIYIILMLQKHLIPLAPAAAAQATTGKELS